ncbi:MAG TPA: metalloregulator ArsR/SmtB family transcription factor [Trueperaceae bacterium]|nr:metalloregulator ArsR/SmtB family transcription factor [Trueperaceae bacterium]
MPPQPLPADLARRLKALADPARLRIVTFLSDPTPECCSRSDGVCACDLEGVLELSQPTVSHHMRQLVEAGVVRSEKRGRWVYYQLDHVALEGLTRDLQALHTPAPKLLQEV